MSTTNPAIGAPASGAPPLLLPGVVRNHLAAITADDLPLRLLFVGPAGSGKTRLLRAVSACFAEKDHVALWVTADTTAEQIAASELLVVDDAHELDERMIEAISDRLRSPEVGLSLAARPWPGSEPLTRLFHDAERVQTPLVLGHVTRSDVMHRLEEEGRSLSWGCIDGVLELAGRIPWLVSEALAVHDDDACDGDPAHRAIREGLADLIAHKLAIVDERLRSTVERLCFAEAAEAEEDLQLVTVAGYAEGLLQRNGHPAPVVVDAVRSTTPFDRIAQIYAASPSLIDDPAVREAVNGVRDARVADALLRDADAALADEPRRALELFRAAAEAGADPATAAVGKARAEWASGDIDAAGSLIDGASIDSTSAAFAAATALSGAVWAARGDLRTAAIVFDQAALTTPDAIAHATVAAVGSGDADILARIGSAPAARTVPSALVVSHELLARGLRSTLSEHSASSLGDLVRATQMYTAASSTAPLPELPAIIAVVAALSLGELAVARTVIDEAVDAEHGGAWAMPRLSLWQAWVAVQRERPHEAEAALRRARSAGALAPRDRMMADAVDVALTRRYADSSALIPVWRRARESILRTRFDLFSILPLGEFAMSAARVGDMDRVSPHLDEVHASLARLGSPALWAAPLHWIGLQCAIQLTQQDGLAPHAKGLLAAAPHTRLAKAMATAGRVWTEVLTGKVDAEAVERAALGLAAVGLAWDGARLAGQGAGRSEDRRVISRLLACARQLHPREELAPTAQVEAAPTSSPATRPTDLLSAREREVAALVLQGKTYAEIGESIFISPRTAEHHIARIRRRLGATSRSDLITKLRLVLDEDVDPDAVIPLGEKSFA